MAGLYVRSATAWSRFRNDKYSGPNYAIPGKVLYAAPTTAYVAGYTVASARSWAREHNAEVYDTINLAYAAAVDGRGDTIVLLPGTHTLTAAIAWSKSGVALVGPEAYCGRKVQKPSAIVVPAAGGAAMAITGADTYIEGIACVPITQQSFATFTGAADGLTIKNCFLDMFTPAVHTSTKGFTGSAGIDNFLFEGNVIWSDGAQGPGLTLSGLNNNALCRGNHWHVDAGTWAVAASLIDIAGLVVSGDRATCGGTAMTACYDGSGTTVVAGAYFERCLNGVNVTKFVDGFGTATHAELVQNYFAAIGGGNGGATLVTVIT